MQLHEISQHNTKFWVSDDVYADFNPNWFGYVPTQHLPNMPQRIGGRQAVTRLTVLNTPMILRHYFRGGVPARFSKDRFLFTGYQHSRSFLEINLLNLMWTEQLPVPKPVAAKCKREGITYQAEILMQEIVDAHTLAEMLIKGTLSERIWQKIGQTIQRFHAFGIQHVDLNVHNILIDASEDIFLIDFDRCKRTPYSASWAERGLQRLERSLEKEKSKLQAFNYQPAMFLQLREGYQLLG